MNTQPEREIIISLNGEEVWTGPWWKTWRIILNLIKERKAITRIEIEESRNEEDSNDIRAGLGW
jgi:hypothetical protein